MSLPHLSQNNGNNYSFIENVMLCLSGFKSIKLNLAKQGSLSNDIDFVANDLLKHNNTIKACLRNLNIILHYSFSLNNHEY